MLRAGDPAVGRTARHRTRLMRPLLDMVMGEGGRQFLDLTTQIIPTVDLAGFSQVFLGHHTAEKDFHDFLGRYDVIISPTWALPPFELGYDAASLAAAQQVLELMRPVLPANLLGLPAAVVPVGISDGMPVGAQVIGRQFADLTCLAVAPMLEDALRHDHADRPRLVTDRPWNPS